MRRRIMGCCGGFSAYVRASSRGASPGPVASTGRAALLPLPLPEGVSETESVGRRAGVASKHRRAAHELASLTIDWLNFESAGRCPIPIPGNVVTGETTPEQRAASARILHQASAMLRACSGKRLRELGLGRGKVAAAWESRDELETLIGTAPREQYRVASVVGHVKPRIDDKSEDIDVTRVKIPEHGAHFDIRPFLDPALLHGFEDPETLRRVPRLDPCPRSCSRLRPSELISFARALDAAGMLYICKDAQETGGVFAVRKSWDAVRKVWTQRLILDRRGRNNVEDQIEEACLGERMPHGSLLCELHVPKESRLRLWSTDLPNFYYSIYVTPERAATNVFAVNVSLDALRDLSAVRRYLHDNDLETNNGARAHLALNSLAMGDINATAFAHCAHERLLEQIGARPVGTTLRHRGLVPRSKVLTGLMIDDMAILTIGPTCGVGSRIAVTEGARLMEKAVHRYRELGVPDVPEKRQDNVCQGKIWGCELRSSAQGTYAGSPLERRAGVAALTVAMMSDGHCTGAQFTSLLGVWSDLLLYRRCGFAILSAAYEFSNLYGDETKVVRRIPGKVVTEMLGLACIAPLLQTSLHSEVLPQLYAVDASLSATGATIATIPQDCANELWRHRVRPGCITSAAVHRGTRGFSFGGELADDLHWKEIHALPLRHNHNRRGKTSKRTINVCEGIARRRHIQQFAAHYQSVKFMTLYDSTVTLHSAARGRARATSLLKEQRKAAACLLAADLNEGGIWIDSERNPADAPSRGAPVLPQASARRHWTNAFLSGDNTALDDRLDQLAAYIKQASPDVTDEGDWIRDLTCDGDIHPHPGPGGPLNNASRRARSAPARSEVDLRLLSRGTSVVTRERRARLLDKFEAFLASEFGAHTDLRSADATDIALWAAEYGQHAYDNGESQDAFAELLNALGKALPACRGRLQPAWDVRTVWGKLEPGENYPPLARIAVRAMTALALIWGESDPSSPWTQAGAVLILAFEGALRPGEIARLRRQDLVFPEEHLELLMSPTGGFVTSPALYIVLEENKSSRLARSSHGARMQHVRLDSDLAVRLAHYVFYSVSKGTMLWGIDGPRRTSHFSTVFRALLEGVGLRYGMRQGFVLSSIRSGGITALWQDTKDIQKVRWLGRWSHVSTLDHYVQELAASRGLAHLRASQRQDLIILSDRLPGLVNRVGHHQISR